LITYKFVSFNALVNYQCTLVWCKISNCEKQDSMAAKCRHILGRARQFEVNMPIPWWVDVVRHCRVLCSMQSSLHF